MKALEVAKGEFKMADNETDANADSASGGKSSKLRLILIIVLLLIILGAAGFGAMYFLMSGSEATSPSTAPAEQTKSEQASQSAPSEKADSNSGANETKATAAESSTSTGAQASKTPSKAGATAEHHGGFGATFTFKPFHLNLGNPLANRYIRLGIAIEYKNGEPQKKEIEAKRAQLRDAIISVTSRKTKEFLLSPDGKDQLRLEILNKVNQYLEKKIDHVFITDMIIE